METKPGYLTTEFWITMITLIGTALPIVGVWDWISNWHAGILSVIIAAVYTFSRGQAKQGVPFDPAVYRAYRLRVKGAGGD